MPYSFADMIDIPALQGLMESLHRASGIPCGILDDDGRVLVATGWREICLRFHRSHPETEALCRESDAFINKHLRREEELPARGYLEYRCKNGMIDIAVPIVIAGRHLANLFLGQFFFDPPDEEFFTQQARRYGFDEDQYLRALRSVPILTRRQVENALDYQTHLVHLLIRLGLERMERMRADEERRRIQDRLEQAQRIAHLGSWEWDLSTGEMFWNAQVFDNFGLNPASSQPSYRRFLESVYPDDRIMIHRSVEQARQTGEVWVEHRILRPDGAIRYLLEQGRVVYAEDRKPTRILGVCYDITEQKQVEIALIESERRLQDILDHSQTMIYLKDLEGRFLFVNQHFEKLFHLEHGAALKKTDVELFSAEAAEVYRSNDRMVLRGKTVQQFEETLVQDDGLHTYLAVKFPLHDSHGRIYATCGLSTDITERKQAEEQVVEALNLAEAARDHLHTVFEAVTDGLIVTGVDRRIALLNRAAERLLDSHPAPLLNRLVADLAEAPLREQIEGVFAGRDQGLTSDLHLAHRDGPLVMQIRSTAVLSEQGKRIGVITMLHDVTRERELDRMKNEFISTAAHELRTPLTSVLGFAQVLFDATDYGLSDPRQQRELLGHIVEKAISLKGIIDDLFDLSRVQAGQLLSLSREPSDICGLLRQIVDSYRRSYASHGFDLALPDECPVVLVDQKKLSQVMENLLSNAVKFSPEGSAVKISAQVGVGFFQVCVADQGIGMTAEQRARIFDKFYRADASNTARGGLGLGMSIVRNIIAGHDGRIWVESEPGRGTRVFFTLPLTEVPVLTAPE